jgi:hypothetical protein
MMMVTSISGEFSSFDLAMIGRERADDSKHSDNLNNLVIASISLGAERSFILSPRQPHRGRGMISEGVKSEEPKDDRVNVKWK